ncbi:sialate O-acetylesterase [Chitinophaga agrisoli]|uniref:Sialate O-acetylesterase n=1 Tax=Chitinophaga agrisoli TaxID=2607653 RepID=A0A5B2VQT0_9BACT|nr:sialate O-acetylesterase [Chitinophaga agrisoli]KAA2240746.1 sialate O-acetylesterase [Chitinophaga agrisoli]
MKHSFLIGALYALCCFQPAHAQVRLPRLVRDSMILQRDTKIKLWGWAGSKEKLTIRFTGKTYHTTANANGEWTIQLAPLPAGGPYTMDLIASNHITLKDILIGDVWLCAGQSNMVLPMERVKEKYPAEIAAANNPAIRHFFISTLSNLQGPQPDLPTGYWRSAVQGDILQFSATAYFFAKNIYEKYHVPIGLINASVGGTPIEAWISEDGLRSLPAYSQRIQQLKDTGYVNPINRNADAIAAAVKAALPPDDGLTAPVKWFDTAYIPKGWRPINTPGYWEEQGIKDLRGTVWYRREITVPAAMAGLPAKLFMGRIKDADFTYVNGVLVGNITYQYPPRRYTVPAGVLRPGKNLVVVRVTNQSKGGGFVPDKPYYLEAAGQRIDLKGEWLYKTGQVFLPTDDDVPVIDAKYEPAALFNAMIAPLTGYTVKGFLWYQGEANTDQPENYKQLLPALINDWRKQWQLGILPFLYVQLPNYMARQYLPSESNWAILREGQLKALSTPNTAMAITIDLGEWNDIHPLNKADVGKRLSLAAQKLAYGDTTIAASGPIYQSDKIEGDNIIITFRYADGGLVAKDGEPLSQFAIAGADKQFVWAQAIISGNTVIVHSNQIKHPMYVRYAWADNPDGANLSNGHGLPASPFRTDQ